MYSLDNSSGVKTMPEIKAKKFEPTEPRWFTEGGNGVPPSYPGADWFNIVQAELLNVLNDGGIAPDKTQLNQITTAIRAIVANAVTGGLSGKAPLSHRHTTADIEGLQTALDEAGKKGLPVGSIVAFPSAVANPVGFLKCDGTTFTQSLYPDLYRVLGNKNTLPNLTNSDIGMTAYFASDVIPKGWIAFDNIANEVNVTNYPDLYYYLIGKYGSLAAVPKAEDRFIRNAYRDLRVGAVQEDAIRNITGRFGPLDNGSPDNMRSMLDGAFYLINEERYHGLNSSWNGNNPLVGFDVSRVVPTANENRPKTLVLKLCIKAKNTFDDVQFWIKAFGSVENQGMMNASQIAVDLQRKANVGHTHTTNDITDFTSAVNNLVSAQITYQKIGNFTIRKYPDGTMIQTYVVTENDIYDFTKKTFNWAISFVEPPEVFTKMTTSAQLSIDAGINLLTESNEKTVSYFMYEHGSYNQGLSRVQFFAIGRWK